MAHSGVYARNRRDLENDGMVVKPVKDKVLTVMQVKERLNCSKAQVYNMITDGLLKSIKIGEKKGIRIKESDVDNFISNQEDM